MMLSKQRKEDSKICRKNPSGKFKCPASEPASVVMAIPWYPKTQSSLLIEPSGNCLEKKSDKNLIPYKIIFKAWAHVLQLLIALVFLVVS